MHIRQLYFYCSLIILMAPVSRAETLNVGLLKSGNPPFAFPKGGKDTGIYVDLLFEIAKITGDDFKLLYLPKKRTLKAFENGEIDIEPGVNPAWRKEWSHLSRYSIPFISYTDVLVFRPNEHFSVSGVNDLFGKKVATVRGYFYPGYEDEFRSGKIHRFNVNHEFQLLKFLSLKQRGADAAFINSKVLHYYMKVNNVAFDIGDTIGNVPVMFRFHKDKEGVLLRFNKALTVLIKNGTLEKILNKYKA